MPSLSACKNNQIAISSRVSYLIGVAEGYISQREDCLEIYKELSKNKHARILRNLCIVRTSLVRYGGKIQQIMSEGYRSLYNLPEYIDKEALNCLNDDNIEVFKNSNKTADQHTIYLNSLISNKINNCRDLFPIWVDWEYIRDLFIMPNGSTKEGIHTARSTYFVNRTMYPFQMYINWDLGYSGNLLYDDLVFINELYKMHGEDFKNTNLVSDIHEDTKGIIYSFIDSSESVAIAVDCENSDPYKLCAALRSLDSRYVSKISKIILVDDVNSSSAWNILERYTSIPIQYSCIPRIKKSKSLVDITLSTAICKEHYTKCVDSFIMFTSDSDYWGATSVLPDVKFLFMVERDSTASEFKEALKQVKIPYCYLDDFYIGNATDIKYDALNSELRKALSENSIDATALFKNALITTRVELTDAEYTQLFKKFFGKLVVSLSADGIISVMPK